MELVELILYDSSTEQLNYLLEILADDDDPGFKQQIIEELERRKNQ